MLRMSLLFSSHRIRQNQNTQLWSTIFPYKANLFFLKRIMQIHKNLKPILYQLSQLKSMSPSQSMSFILSQLKIHSTNQQFCGSSKNQHRTSSLPKKMSPCIMLLMLFGLLKQIAPDKRNSMIMTSKIMSFLAVPSHLEANTKARLQFGRSKAN